VGLGRVVVRAEVMDCIMQCFRWYQVLLRLG
jgi:hypothetical protein